MFLTLPKVFATVLLCLTVLLRSTQGEQVTNTQSAKSVAQTTQTVQPATLEFREFFDPEAQELKASAKLLALNGQHVRMVGFMARLENPPKGAFYLCPRPTYGDESGGGTADLPVDHVRVIVSSAKDKELSFIPQLIEVTGILEVGNQAEADGTVSSVRLLLDAPMDMPAKPHSKSNKARQKLTPKTFLPNGAKSTTRKK